MIRKILRGSKNSYLCNYPFFFFASTKPVYFFTLIKVIILYKKVVWNHCCLHYTFIHIICYFAHRSPISHQLMSLRFLELPGKRKKSKQAGSWHIWRKKIPEFYFFSFENLQVSILGSFTVSGPLTCSGVLTTSLRNIFLGHYLESINKRKQIDQLGNRLKKRK